MKKLLSLCFILAAMFTNISLNVNAQGVIMYSDSFLQGQTAAPQKCTDWNTFKSQLTPKCYTKVTIKGTYDNVGKFTTDPVIIAAIANALNTNTTYISPSTNGNVWHYCNISSTQIWINPVSSCSGSNCPNPGYIIRPCIGNSNWGGVNTATCNGLNQRMTLIFEYDSTLGNATNIIGTDSVCPGDTVAYSTTWVTGASSYTWTLPSGWNIISGQGTTSIFALTGSNGGTISFQAKNLCDSTTITKSVFVGAYPVITLTDDTTICNGQSVQLSASGGSFYSWTPTLGLSCTNCPNPVANPTNTTKYFVSVSDSAGCESLDSVTITIDPCVGIENATNTKNIKILPNPSTGKFLLQLSSLISEETFIEISDINGKIVFKEKFASKNNALNETIDLQNQGKGIYQISIKNNHSTITEKIVIQ
ncbi:MAG: T9SS type A sorting domain-containing protein [Bacteroidetes bacterium]|nr:T9SS C-terminal target domain-containing protein [Bacteroidota bacterium]MBV6462230.1 hypothetical protein [Flavobacteriales bacterium]WKZ74814.1 MAG: T9SS type A sorting domain-containing protein [Vicingaceae bacterium]MCL4816036.1 T9SS type A sorting domain-containing protein [Flavobacteriales bacterium]NOG95195.1 T9SS type A sorting domain-containing protein [Bacteroidota bacterium]